MKQKMIMINEEDFEYIKSNIPNFSIFVREQIVNHKLYHCQTPDQENMIKNKIDALNINLNKVTMETNKEIIELQHLLDGIKEARVKAEFIKNDKRVIERVNFLKTGKGDINSVAKMIKKETGYDVTPAQLEVWVKEAKQ